MNERPALREPMVWLMIGLPAASVVFAFWLLVAAIRSGGADEVTDTVRRTADVQVAEIGPDVRAQSMKLLALLRVEDAALDVLPVNGDFARNQSLILTLSHPTDAKQDRRFILRPNALGWRIPGDVRASHDWIVQLASSDGSWRLHGRIKAGQRAVRMEPAFAGD